MAWAASVAMACAMVAILPSASSLNWKIGPPAKSMPKQFVYVKFHHVGSETAHNALRTMRNESDAFLDLNRGLISNHDGRFLTSHADTLPLLEGYVHAGVPKTTWAVTLMRHPGNQFLSYFFQAHFQLKHSDQNYQGPFKNLTRNSAKDMWDIERIHYAIMPGDFSPFSEYTTHLKDKDTARRVLSQFKVVGITEDSDATFYRPISELIGVSYQRVQDVVFQSMDHVRPPHPSMRDFNSDFNMYIQSRMDRDYEIYGVAVELSGTRLDPLAPRYGSLPMA